MPDRPQVQAERVFVQAMCREVDFCPFREPGARLLRTATIPFLVAEINPMQVTTSSRLLARSMRRIPPTASWDEQVSSSLRNSWVMRDS